MQVASNSAASTRPNRRTDSTTSYEITTDDTTFSYPQQFMKNRSDCTEKLLYQTMRHIAIRQSSTFKNSINSGPFHTDTPYKISHFEFVKQAITFFFSEFQFYPLTL